MKKILIALIIGLQPSFTYSANTNTTSMADELVDIIDQHSYQMFLSDENTTKTAEVLLTYFQLKPSAKNRQAMASAVKKYYNQPDVRQKFKAKSAALYQSTFSEQEIQTWTDFFKTPHGQSILKNQAYFQGISDTVENLFPVDQQPSPEAEKKIMDIIMQSMQGE